MKNYIDYMWAPSNVYKVFSNRRLISDVYGLGNTNVLPIDVREVEGIDVVREGAVGEVYVRFDSFENYVKAFRTFSYGKYLIMIKGDLYDKFLNQYRSVVDLPSTGSNEKIYVEPSSSCVLLPNQGFVLTVNIYYTSGFYTQYNIDANDKSYDERKDVYRIRDEWLETLDRNEYGYMIEQTHNIESIIEHIMDINNSYEGQLELFKKVVNGNKIKGFKLCLYKIHYLNVDKTTMSWAYEPEQLFNKLDEMLKSKVSGIETIAVCDCDFEVGVKYRIILDGGREATFVFKNMKQFGEVTSFFINRNYRFRIVQY